MKRKSSSEKDAVKRLREADAALNAYQCTDADDPTYLRLNKAANDAAAEVSWWRRGTKHR